ncbi:MAG: hypothetical protein AW10_01495 [Candidatus Accumulibacter appositus]|uniref:DUF2062 domain-containing protein n=1 Tax=Candidatus Accumulibacter appositus TaxID=1454003 RepID=A0A011PV19_9PROT|nr:DUF2062 domain-containing protein [Accumulibacter sp.]EXI80882.1 MAG: hypothetical protein AW10_01495 [Candidatus Accumulibacter appositus]HRF03861.1 DUF2062 domain-containing protein [Accumulibacter sp.]
MFERWRALIPTREQIGSNRWLRWLAPYLGHPKLWHWSRRGVALGVGIGVFFGLLIPIAQIPFAAAAAVILRANLPAAAASTLVTNPITFAPVYFAAYKIGAWVTGEKLEPPAAAAGTTPADANAGIWRRITALGTPLVVGLAITASLIGLASYVLTSAGWYWYVRRKRRRLRRS